MLVEAVGRMAREGFAVDGRVVRFGRLTRSGRRGWPHDWRRWATTRE